MLIRQRPTEPHISTDLTGTVVTRRDLTHPVELTAVAMDLNIHRSMAVAKRPHNDSETRSNHSRSAEGPTGLETGTGLWTDRRGGGRSPFH